MQMNLFATDVSETTAKTNGKRKTVTRVMQEQVMLIDRPAPGEIRRVDIKPEIVPDPMDSIEDDIERWDGLY